MEYIPLPDMHGHSERKAALPHETSWDKINTLLDNYNQTFRPTIDQLYQKLQDPTVNPMSQVLGTGNRSIVFRADYEGRDYAVRTPKSKANRDNIIYQHVCGAVRCKGVPHLEQIVAASIEDGVTVAEILPGKPMDKSMTIDDVRSISDDQLIELIKTLHRASSACLELDISNPSNVLYDREEGFGIVDYYCTDLSTTHIIQPVSITAGLMADVLMSAGIHNRDHTELLAASFEADTEQLLANSDVLKRYRALVATYLEGSDAVSALDEIDMILNEYHEIITQYQDPSWKQERALASAALGSYITLV